MDLVSIIIPNYNSELTIVETIESVRNQTYSEWELLIVDDGSTDGSENIIKPFISSRIHYIKRPDTVKKGGNACRNLGIRNAKGQYLIFLDSDDLLAPYCLQQRIDYISKHNDLDFAVFNQYSFSDNIENHKLHSHLTTDDPLEHFLGLNCLWQTTSPIWKTEFMKKIMFDEDFPRLQDPEMTIRALSYKGVKYKVIVDSVPDSYYRIADKNLRKKKGKKDNTPTFWLFISKISQVLNHNQKFQKSRESLFYLVSLEYMLNGQPENQAIYTQVTNTLCVQKTINSKIIYKLCSAPFKGVIMSNKFTKIVFIKYIGCMMKRLWGKNCVSY